MFKCLTTEVGENLFRWGRLPFSSVFCFAPAVLIIQLVTIHKNFDFSRAPIEMITHVIINSEMSERYREIPLDLGLR